MVIENQEKKQKPISNTNKVKPTISSFLFSAFFGLPAIGAIILGFYLSSMDGDWWVLAFFLPIAVVLGFFAYVGLPIQRKVIYSYELDDERILQQWENTKTGEIKRNTIPYTQVNKVLIGLNPVHIRIRSSSMNGSVSYFRFEAVLFIMHKDGTFTETFGKADDLRNWINHLENKVNITYTSQDLSKAIQSAGYAEVDFSQIEGTSVDVVTEHIGKENSNNPFPVWLPHDVQEEVAQKKDNIIRLNTKKAEKRTIWILFFYAIISAVLLLPNALLDADGFIEFTNAILLWYLGVNLVIPILSVFFRRYSKWYNPILYITFVSIGNTIGIFIASLFIDFPSMYPSILILNIFNIILWTFAMIGAKIIKLLFKGLDYIR